MPTVREIIEQDPEYVIGLLLKSEFWLQSLSTMQFYTRHEDDTMEGSISVGFGMDGDGWIEVMSKPDPNEAHTTFRFRMDGGGGQSPRVRVALLVLAEAIRLDNAEHPQDRG